jgi:hypothetical protein
MHPEHPQLAPDVDLDDGPDTTPISLVEENLNTLATSPRLPAYVRSRNVRQQFQFAFELIGGIPRLAHWAHANPDKFYQLYARLIPAQVTGGDGGAIKIELSWLNARDTSGQFPPQFPGQVIDVPPSK